MRQTNTVTKDKNTNLNKILLHRELKDKQDNTLNKMKQAQ